MEHESLTLKVHGFELHADQWNGGTSTPVLLLHGLGGNSITWHGVGPTVAKALGARVLAVDLPGFGASRPGVASVGLPLLSELVLGLMSAEAPNQSWHLAGNSLGGVLVLDVARRAPQFVARVTLAALALPLIWGRSPREVLALAGYVPTALPWFGRKLVARYVRGTGVPGVVDDPVRFLFAEPGSLDPTLRQRLIEVSEYRMTWAGEAARALEQTTRSLGLALVGSSGVTRAIREARCPVRAIRGSHDPLYPDAAWQELSRQRPDWSYVCLPNVGHVPQLEAPALFAEHMLAPW